MNKPVLLVLLLVIFTTQLRAQPANNLCASAVNRNSANNACSALAGQTLLNATATGSPASGYGTPYDVWYTTVIPAGVSSITITLTATGGSINNTNTFIEAYNASTCAAVTAANSIGVGSRGTGLTLADLTPGATYYFRVFTTTNPTSGTWTFSLCVVNTTTAPANDNCAGAVALTVGTATTGSLLGATASAGIPVGCATGTPDDDVWYSFVANQNFAVVTLSPGAALNASGAMIQIFSGACGGLTSIACGKMSAIATGLTAGNTYFVRVYSFGTAGSAAVGGPAPGMSFDIAVTPVAATTGLGSRMNEVFQQTLLSAPNILFDPWEITYGPDGFLWITESKGNRVWRMDPATGARTVVLDLTPNGTFFSSASDKLFNIRTDMAILGPQGGLAGLAIHPKFLDATTPKNYVYVSYIYTFVNSLAGNAGNFYTNRIARFTYNTSTGLLESPVSVVDTIPGSNDHNSQRMIIAPVGGTDYLFYAAGDMGAGQFGNAMRENKAQNILSYEGKILRFNLEPDADAGAYDQWIPNDNPFNGANQSAIWSWGIRNNQGFAYAKINGVDMLYGASHGPFSDDEMNIIKRSINYGHPQVIGFSADGNYNNAKAGTSASLLPLISNEQLYVNNTIGVANYGDPIYSFYPEPAGNTTTPSTIQYIYTNQTYPAGTYPPGGAAQNLNQYWASEGISGIGMYNQSLIPGWKNSIMLGALKGGKVIRLKLTSDGTAVVPPGPAASKEDTIMYFRSTNRFRDVAITADGKTIYTIIDKSSTTSGPTTGNPIISACPGCVQKNTFLGYNVNAASLNRSTIPTNIPVAAGLNNQCENDNTVVINASNNNNNLWVPITDTNSNIVAEIYAQNRSLGTSVTASTYTTSTIRVSNGKKYLGRNITITPQTQPGGTVSIRLYISKAEFDALQASPGSGISTISDMRILKNSDACGAALASNTSIIVPTVAEAFGSNAYVLQADISSFSTFYFGSSLLTLPVELMTFEGNLKNDATLLHWKTAQELNTSRYVVERSIDGTNFSDIGTVAANGNSTSPLDYYFTDKEVTNLPATTVYYRLRIIDTDNSFKYTNIISVTLPAITGTINVTPNPVSAIAKVLIGAATEGRASWKLVDNAGRVIIQGAEQMRKGNNQFNINMAKLASGVYYLNVKGAGINNHIKVQKL